MHCRYISLFVSIHLINQTYPRAEQRINFLVAKFFLTPNTWIFTACIIESPGT